MADVADSRESTPEGNVRSVIMCIVCVEEVKDRMEVGDPRQLNCGHMYYWSCLADHIKYAINSRPFKPIKCCGLIHAPSSEIWHFQTHPESSLLDTQLAEFLTKNDDYVAGVKPLYCHRQTCNAYIPATDRTSGAGLCRDCNVKTCVTCGDSEHDGDCNIDEAFQHLASVEGWKKCPHCEAMVEKIEGCNHMECHCGTGFCYKCGLIDPDDGSHGHESDDEFGNEYNYPPIGYEEITDDSEEDSEDGSEDGSVDSNGNGS
ncbi:hypothetical protein PG987_016350 [Apiospora arundinis]